MLRSRLTLCLAVLCALCACAPPVGSPGRGEPAGAPADTPRFAGPLPQPTEHWLADEAERENREGRKKWMEEMHRAAPGTDWRLIERRNGELLMDERNARVEEGIQMMAPWTERGSRNQAGRMHAVALGLDGSRLYAGSSRGGVWRGGLQGESWEPLADNLWGGAHHLAVTEGATEIILSLTNGGRLRYSEDDGLTWLSPSGLPGGINGGIRLLNDPVARQRVYFLANRGGTRELYRSEDAGLSFELVRTIGDMQADLWMHRLGGTPLLLAQGSEVYRSDDLGDSWQLQGTVPESAADGVVIAASEAGAPSVYVAVKPSRDDPWRLYGSDDGGSNWDYRNDIDDFWRTMSASLLDPDLMATGGVEVYRSPDGGRTFNKVNNWGEYYGDPANKLHADTPGMAVVPNGTDEIWFVATDGGLFRSDDGLLTVRNLSLEGLGVSQYYTTHTSINDPDLILAGAQDQGYQRTADASEPYQTFDQLISGDYGHLTSGDNTHQIIYSVYPGFILVQTGETGPELRQVGFPENEQYMWMPYILANPDNPTTLYFCASHLYFYSKNAQGDWEYALDYPDPFTDADGRTLTALAISPLDHDLRLAVNDRGALYWSDDAGSSWNLSTDTGPSSHYFYGTALEYSPLDPDVAYVAGSGYSNPGVYRTRDGGRTWTAVWDGMPSTLVYDIVFQSPTSDVLFAATEAGPYRLEPSTDTWEYIGGDVAPLTTYWSVEAVPAAGVIRYGTYGRGIWDHHITGPGIPEECFDNIDNDTDGLTDCDDPDCADVDTDGDTWVDCGDCAPGDNTTWSEPVAIPDLRVQKFPGGGNQIFQVFWSSGGAGGSATRYDLVAGTLTDLHASGWPVEGICLAEDRDRTSYLDISPPGSRWYLARAANDCGETDYGAVASGPRSLSAGDCN